MVVPMLHISDLTVMSPAHGMTCAPIVAIVAIPVVIAVSVVVARAVVRGDGQARCLRLRNDRGCPAKRDQSCKNGILHHIHPCFGCPGNVDRAALVPASKCPMRSLAEGSSSHSDDAFHRTRGSGSPTENTLSPRSRPRPRRRTRWPALQPPGCGRPR